MPEASSPAAPARSRRDPTLDVDAPLDERRSLSPGQWVLTIPHAIVLVALWICIRLRSSRRDSWSPGC